MPPEIKQNKILRSHWVGLLIRASGQRADSLSSHQANVKFWAFVVDDCYGAPLIGLGTYQLGLCIPWPYAHDSPVAVPGLGDAAAGAILLVVTFYYYNGFMNALDRQMRLDYASDPQMLKEYERIKRKHNKGIRALRERLSLSRYC